MHSAALPYGVRQVPGALLRDLHCQSTLVAVSEANLCGQVGSDKHAP